MTAGGAGGVAAGEGHSREAGGVTAGGAGGVTAVKAGNSCAGRPVRKDRMARISHSWSDAKIPGEGPK